MVCVAAVRQFQIGLADWVSKPARVYIDNLLGKPYRGLPDTAAWRDAVSRLEQASALDPGNAHYPMYEGLAYYLRVRGFAPQGPLDSLARPYLTESVVRLTRAAQLNPRMGQAMAALVVSKARLGFYDSQFHNAFDRAAQFAPYEPVTLAPMLSLGFASWPYLQPATRSAVEQMAQRANRISPEWYGSFAKSYLAQGRVCQTSPASSPCGPAK